MTTSSIKELSSFLTAKASAGITQMGATAKGKAASSFSDVLNMAGKQDGQSLDSGAGTDKLSQVTAKKAVHGKNVQGGLVRTPNEADNVERTSAIDNPDRTDVCDKVDDTLSKIADIVKEQFSITDEELERVMEELSMAMVDLLNPNMLKELCVEISGADNEFALLTDESLYAEVQNVLTGAEELVEELKAELDMNDQDFAEIVRSFAGENEVKTNESNAPIFENVSKDTDAVQKEMKLSGKLNEQAAETTETDGTEVEVVTEEAVKTQDGKERHDSKQGESKENSNSEISPIGVRTEGEQPVQTIDEVRPHYSSAQQSADIARQIVEQVKVQISQEKTQLEMELNPASLGKVALNVESRNGVITAAFTAQNEAVKAAIEGQITILQENLDKQGVKVEAVEVTVASHKFEENLHKDNEENRKEQEAEEAAKISGRQRTHINLLDSDFEEGEELTEDEEINKDMMLRNGNSVDYTA